MRFESCDLLYARHVPERDRANTACVNAFGFCYLVNEHLAVTAEAACRPMIAKVWFA